MAVRGGKLVISIPFRLLPHAEPIAGKSGPLPVPFLTPRETEVFQGILEGQQNKEIAAKLHISVRTVKSHVEGLLRKFGARNRVEVRMAFWKRA